MRLQAGGFCGLLCIVGLIGCIFKNDYNSVIGLGLLFLLTKHYNIANLKSIFILVALTILADIFQIVVVTDQPPFPRFVITVIEIICKIGILLGMKGAGAANTNKEAQANKNNAY